MKLRDDWRERLAGFLEHNRERPFRWGSWDCCLFVSDAVRVMTGVDMAGPMRGTYHTAHGAFCAVRGQLEIFASIMARRHGLDERVRVRDAEPGDIVLARIDGRDTLGVVAPNRLPVFVTDRGLAAQSLGVARRVWRIERCRR